MHTIDFLIILAYVLYSIYIGFQSKDLASKNLEEYFLAGRTMTGWKAGISLASTQFAADTPLLVTGLIATAGIFSLWQLWIYGISFLLIGFLLGPRWRNVRVLTDAELSELRYSGKPALFLRGFKAFYFGTVFNCVVLAMVLLAGTRISEPFLFWDQWLHPVVFNSMSSFVDFLGLNLTLETKDAALALKNSTSNFISIGVIVAVTAMYSMTGGLRAVVDTDIVQFGVMMAATALYVWYAVSAAGGMEQIHTKIAELSANGTLSLTPTELTAFTPMNAFNVSIPLLAAFALQWLIQMNSDGTGYIAQRLMACKSDHDAKMATVVFTITQILVRSLLWIPLGLALIVLYPPTAGLTGELFKADRELTYIRGMAEYLPVGVVGILLTGMLAALASTLDTHLNWGASYWTNDIYKRILCEAILKKQPKPRSLVWVARFSNLMVLFISIYVMTHMISIQTAWQISLMLGAGMGIPLLLRWLWWRMNAWAEIAAIAASLVAAPFALYYFGPEDTYLQLLVMAGVSTLAAIIACYVAGPESHATLKAFYQQAKPVGFWGPISASKQQATHEYQTMVSAIAATFLAALSIFCLLTGFGSIIANSAAPPWFPYEWPWRILLIGVGALLLPIWWKLGVTERLTIADLIRKRR